MFAPLAELRDGADGAHSEFLTGEAWCPKASVSAVQQVHVKMRRCAFFCVWLSGWVVGWLSRCLSVCSCACCVCVPVCMCSPRTDPPRQHTFADTPRGTAAGPGDGTVGVPDLYVPLDAADVL